jgi:ribonuclease BN (tRNA processing enzyme)
MARAGPSRFLHVLGSGGWLPSDERETSSYALRCGANLIVFDAGTGFRRLITDPALMDGVSRLDVLISHFHLDHTVGLGYLDALDRSIERHIWGPGALLYGKKTEEVLSRLLTAPFTPASTDRLYTSIRDFSDEPVVLGPNVVHLRAQRRHSHPSVAFRVDDELAYCTDTAYDQGTISFVASVRYLLHEAWVAGTAGTRFHSSAAEAAQIAKAAHVRRLMLVHLDPRIDLNVLLEEAREVFPDVELAVDKMSLPLDV